MRLDAKRENRHVKSCSNARFLAADALKIESVSKSRSEARLTLDQGQKARRLGQFWRWMPLISIFGVQQRRVSDDKLTQVVMAQRVMSF